MSLAEIANICYVHSGRKPSKHTVKRVLSEDPIPLKMMKRFDPYHEIPEPKERRMAVVRLHSQGWTPKSIAGYLKTHKSTVYRVLRRWIEEGEDGLEDKPHGKPHGRPPGIRKVDLKAIDAVRRLQQNPELGEFRVHAALAQMGIDLSPATCGRILALNRRLYGLGKPKGGPHAREEGDALCNVQTPRVLDHRRALRRPSRGRWQGLYVISILENHSRAILSSAVSRSARTQPLTLASSTRRWSATALRRLSRHRWRGAIFRANQALSIYEALDIAKEEIERGKPWQSYIETTFNIQHRMADWHYFARAQKIGPSSSRCTSAGWTHTTTRAIGPTATAKTAGALPWRYSGG